MDRTWLDVGENCPGMTYASAMPPQQNQLNFTDNPGLPSAAIAFLVVVVAD
jgi:hypothetical protein